MLFRSSELVRYFTVKFGYLVVYSFSISLLASFLVLLYNDLYFDLSVTFMLNYLFKDWFLKNNILYPLIVAAVLIILFMIKWKRGRKI